MRFDRAVYMQHVVPGAYNKNTGNYEPETLREYLRYASVTDAKTETINLIYGHIKQGVLVVRLQRRYLDRFDYIRIGRRRYKVDYERRLRNMHVFVVSEVQ